MMFLKSLKRIILGRPAGWPESIPQPDVETGRVIFTGFGPRRFSSGKVQPETFFPPFCSVLAEHGFGSYFVDRPEALQNLVSENTFVVHVYREVTDAELLHRMDPPRHARMIFNDPATGIIIANKDKTNQLYTRHRLPVPEVAPGAGPIFSNEAQSSGADVQVLDSSENLDPSRYNTRFIDTRVSFGDEEFCTTVRLLCVGPEILHAFVRARPASEGSPSVHASNTPRNPELIEFLQQVQVERNLGRFRQLAADLHRILGPGFYAHDLLVERESDAVYVCESGYKFDAAGYVAHLAPITESLSSHRILFTEEFARRSAAAFLSQCSPAPQARD